MLVCPPVNFRSPSAGGGGLHVRWGVRLLDAAHRYIMCTPYLFSDEGMQGEFWRRLREIPVPGIDIFKHLRVPGRDEWVVSIARVCRFAWALSLRFSLPFYD